MLDISEQLAVLRRKVARIDKKFSSVDTAPRAPRVDPRPARYFVEEWLHGAEVQTPFGKHFETERLYPGHKRHGSFDVSSLNDLPADLLGAISEGQITPSACTRWAFLDTETTGLAGGSGTYAFLIGVGRITAEGFLLRQFFMRDLQEEASLLYGLAQHLSEFDTLVTYNGITYDQPLIETRYRMARAKPPFSSLEHFDLLFGARRLWRLRFDNCRLTELENQILGIEREGDLPGEMIPYVYFEYLRTGEAFKLVPILHHNALDILTLACLTALVPWAFRSPEDAPLAHGAEMVGLGRWLLKIGQLEKALILFRRAIDKGVSDELLFRTLWDVARIEKRLGRDNAAVLVFTEISSCRNSFRAMALEELAKHYEHREKNHALALEFTLSALGFIETKSLIRRRDRLSSRLAKRRVGESLL